MLKVKENKAYTLNSDAMYTECIQDVSNMETQVRLGKDRIGEDRIGESETRTPKESKHVFGEYSHVRLTDTEHDKLIEDYGQEMTDSCITFLDEYIEMKGYKAKSHYLCIRKWVVDAVKERQTKGSKTNKVADQLEQSYEMMTQWAEEG